MIYWIIHSFFPFQLSRYLFRGNNPFGLDLAAINIYRGREHGVRSYNDYVELAGHKRIHSFDEFGPDVRATVLFIFFTFEGN